MGDTDFGLLEDQHHLAAYLLERGLLEDGEQLSVAYLGGGISNRIALISTPRQAFVLKQAQPKLKVKVDWFAPVHRVLIEAEAMEAWRPMLPPGTVPEILFIDRQRFLYAMEAAPPDSVLWKVRLMRGEVDLGVARAVGEILGRMHSGTATDAGVRGRFQDRRILQALRIDPCFRYLIGVYPHLEPAIGEQVERLEAPGLCLVHGDYTPKNMLVSGSCITLLDYEIAHWGNPALDSGFVVAHLLLKAIHAPEWADSYVKAAWMLWTKYVGQVTFADTSALEKETAWIVPFLMLARIDSKSPVEYIVAEDRKEVARRVSLRLIERPIDSLGAILEHVVETVRESTPTSSERRARDVGHR